MTSVEQPQIREECDLLNDAPCQAKEETPKTSHLVVDTKVKQSEVQGVPVSASTAGTVQTAQTHVVEKVVEKVAAPSVTEVRHELLHLHDKIDEVLGHTRSRSAHRVSYVTVEPYESVKKSSAYTSVYSVASHHKRDTSVDSVHSAALTARAVARAQEYMLEVNGLKKKTQTGEKEKTSSVYHSQYLYSKPSDLSTSLYKSSILTSSPSLYTSSVIRVPSYQPTYTVYYATRDVLPSSIRSEKVKSSAVQIVDVKDNCHYCGHEITKKQVVNGREEREVRSAAPRQNEEEDIQEVSVAKKLGKRREILDERKHRSAQRVNH